MEVIFISEASDTTEVVTVRADDTILQVRDVVSIALNVEYFDFEYEGKIIDNSDQTNFIEAAALQPGAEMIVKYSLRRQIKMIRNNEKTLSDFPSDVRHDYRVVAAAIGVNVTQITELDKEKLHNDYKLQQVIASTDGLALAYLPHSTCNDKDIVIRAVTNNGCALHFASSRLQDDKEIAIASISSRVEALTFTSDRLRNNFDVVKAAVSQKGTAIRHASLEMRRNIEICTEAYSNDNWAINHIDPLIRDRIVNTSQK